jgi:hypothetical protein
VRGSKPEATTTAKLTPKLTENEIVGEALVALRHDELKEMGIASVGHRLTILKSVYDVKVNQDIPVDPDHYIPLCMPLAHRWQVHLLIVF